MTPIAEWLLDRAARDLARSYGPRGWSVVRCERCGRISTVVDHLTESVFGARVDPPAFGRPVRRVDDRLPDEPLDALPVD